MDTILNPPATERVIKRRASKACLRCRGIKKKCTVVTTGVPCTSCRNDEVQCLVPKSRRRKRFQIDAILPKHVPVLLHDEDRVNGSGNSLSSLDHFLANAPTSLDFELSSHISHIAYTTSEIARVNDEVINHNSSETEALPSDLTTTVQTPFILNTPLNPTQVRSNMPSYIRPPSSRIDIDDIEILLRRGALTVPGIELRNELLRNYAQYVHPYLPFLDLQEFVHAIVCEDGSEPISLTLFQAVMFASTAFIDIQFLKAAGYASRKTARKSYFQKAKVLYDFDYDSDRISTIQALLLMTYWYETPDDEKDPSYWLGLSLSLARATGLHRQAEQANADLKQQRLRKRLWWCCFMRDQLIALSMRKPTHIKNEDFDIPMLAIDDFETQALPTDFLGLLENCRTAQNATIRRKLARLCIEKAKLCQCISDVFTAQYFVLGRRLADDGETTMMLTPKTSVAESYEFFKCEQELNKWRCNLPDDCCYRKLESKGSASLDDDEVLLLHRAVLSMIYSTVASALHRPQVLSKMPAEAITRSLQQFSRQRVKEAATTVAEIAADLEIRNLIRFLPPVGVTVLIPAVVVHVLDIKFGDAAIRNVGLIQFNKCIQALQRLQDIYWSADAALLFLEPVVKKAQIKLADDVNQEKAELRGEEKKSNKDASTPLTDANDAEVSDKIMRTTDNVQNSTSQLTPPSSREDIHQDLVEPPSAFLEEPLSQYTITASDHDFNATIDLNMWPDRLWTDDYLNFDLDNDWTTNFSFNENNQITAHIENTAPFPVFSTP